MAAEMDQTFEKLIETLVEHQKLVGEGELDQSKPRPWLNFSSQTMKTPLTEKDEEKLHESLTRDELEEKYITAANAKAGESKANEMALPKLQGDFLAAVERDKRMQMRSRIRQFAHSAARSAGRGNDKGFLRKHTLDYLSRIYLKAEDKQKDGSSG